MSSALERIKEIQQLYLDAKEDGWEGEIGGDKLEFLLRAFHVMRSVAARYKQDLDVRHTTTELLVPMWAYVQGEVEEEFEKRMGEGK